MIFSLKPRRAEYLNPLQIVFAVAVIGVGLLLLGLWTSAQNTAHKNTLLVLDQQLGGTTLLTNLLEHTLEGVRVRDAITTNNARLANAVADYFTTHHLQDTTYLLKADDRIIAQSDKTPISPQHATIYLPTNNQLLTITLEYAP